VVLILVDVFRLHALIRLEQPVHHHGSGDVHLNLVGRQLLQQLLIAA
jgi:hypothetical protein